MEFLWVRWFSLDATAPGGFKTHRLHRLTFIHHENENAFGFIDPKDVIRAAHLIGAYSFGRTNRYLTPSIARQPGESDED